MGYINVSVWVPDGQERVVEAEIAATLRRFGYQSTLELLLQEVVAEGRRRAS